MNLTRMFVQYGYDDEENAPVLQTAESEREALRCGSDCGEGVWYEYEVQGRKLVNGRARYDLKVS